MPSKGLQTKYNRLQTYMPLDLKKVITHLSSLEKQDTYEINKTRLDLTYKLLLKANTDKHDLTRKLIETQNSLKANFFFASPDIQEFEKSDLVSFINCNKNFSTPHITIATDGSQINPSSHEITNTSLINIGKVSIPYYKSDIPVLLSSEPAIFNSTEDIFPFGISHSIQDEDLISYERTLREIEELVSLAKKYIDYKLPVIALLDGTLIHWHIEKFSDQYIQQFMKRFSSALLELRSLGIPVASFLSNSRSSDIINMLKVFKCPYESVDCKKYCSSIDSKNLPCNPTLEYKSVLDRKLIEKLVSARNAEAGSRTILYKSNSKILNLYSEELKISFFYLNTGTEVARVELPSYVVSDSKFLDLIHNAIAFQCKVGFGYPVVLSEAHLQAVVNKVDRKVFYDLIKEHLLSKRYSDIRLSNKELKKRISFV